MPGNTINTGNEKKRTLRKCKGRPGATGVNVLNPNSDQCLISPYIITAYANIQVMRIEEMISKDEIC